MAAALLAPALLLLPPLLPPLACLAGCPPAAPAAAAGVPCRVPACRPCSPPHLHCAHPCAVPQGDTDASTFYVLERGSADVRIFKDEWGEERKVHTYQPGRWVFAATLVEGTLLRD